MMTEQTETERNEAKAKYLFENCWYWVKPDEANYIESMVDSLSIIISAQDMKRIMQDRTTALKQQSEAERRVERVREYCEERTESLKTVGLLSRSSRYFIEGKIEAYADIVSILEGKTK